MADLRETAGKLIEHIRAHPEGVAETIRENNPGITEDAAQRLALLFIGQFEPGLSAAERDQRGRAYRKELKASGGKQPLADAHRRAQMPAEPRSVWDGDLFDLWQ